MYWTGMVIHRRHFPLLCLLVIFFFLFQIQHGNIPSTEIILKPITLKPVCKGIIEGDNETISQAVKEMEQFPKATITPKEYLKLTINCESFKNRRSYIQRVVQTDEKDFPLAFGISIYKDIEQFERLLRAIYRPQNYYCIHIDAKSPKIFHQAVQSISSCFSNVILASTFVDVRWGEFTVLEAQLICLRDLWTRYKAWKYYINLTGQEFPLRTNRELVKILQAFNGSSLAKGVKPTKRIILNRFHYVFRGVNRTKAPKTSFGRNFTLVKGSTHVVLSRPFVNFTLHSPVASEFLEWVKDTGIPDETFVPSLYANMKGKELQISDIKRKLNWNARYKNWGQFPCYGKVVRKICINGIRDVHFIITRPELFINKFHLNYQYLALDCMEQWLHNKTLAENKIID